MLTAGEVQPHMNAADVISVCLIQAFHEHEGEHCFRDVVHGTIREETLRLVCSINGLGLDIFDATPGERDLFAGAYKNGQVAHIYVPVDYPIEIIDVIEQWNQAAHLAVTAYFEARRGKEFVYEMCSRSCCRGTAREMSELAFPNRTPEQLFISYDAPPLSRGFCQNGCCRSIDRA